MAEILTTIIRIVFLLFLSLFFLKILNILETSTGIKDKNPPKKVEAFLVIMQGEQFLEADPGASFLLGEKCSIGRNEENQIVIHDLFSSNFHASISLRQNKFFIKDMESTNGTLLNEAPLTGEKPLKSGDTITIGGVKFKFEVRAEEKSGE